MFVAPTVMWLPAVPSCVEVIVTVLPVALGVLRPRLAAQRPMALVAPLPRFDAKVDVLLLVAKVAVKFGATPPHEAEVVPLELPVMLPQENPLKVLARARKAPGVESVTVTVLVLALAVAPTVAGKDTSQALMAAARLVAKPEVSEAIIKVPLVDDGHVCVPSVPPERALGGVKLLNPFVSVMLFPDVPGFKAVIFTTPEPGAAELTPTNEPQPAVLMTVLRRVASVLAVVLRVKLAFFGLVASPHPVVLPPEATAVTMREFDPLVIVNV